MVHAELLIEGHFIGGPCDGSVGKSVMRSPWDGAVVGTAAEGGESELRTALESASEAFASWRFSPPEERAAILLRTAEIIRREKESLARLLAAEIGKPVSLGRAEAERAAITFDLAADLVSFGREDATLASDPRATRYTAHVERRPRGVVFGIVPYNWPLNLTAHKLAPALASGTTIVVKPSPLAPISTLELLRIVHEAGAPPGVVNGWHGDHRLLAPHLASARTAMISFTGSAAVGWGLKRSFPEKPITLELGGNASVVVLSDADLDRAARTIVAGAFAYAGQICISVQHVWAARPLHDELRERLLAETSRLGVGDPMDEATVCGPMITAEAAARTEAWIAGSGGERLTPSRREGNVLWPTVVAGASLESNLMREEVFGPVMTLDPFDDVEDAIALVNGSRYGIQAGVFGREATVLTRSTRELEVGGVVINDVPTVRFDALPYGGVKRSGFGREGVRWAIEEMTAPHATIVRKE